MYVPQSLHYVMCIVSEISLVLYAQLWLPLISQGIYLGVVAYSLSVVRIIYVIIEKIFIFGFMNFQKCLKIIW